jgi:hypothetical protein
MKKYFAVITILAATVLCSCVTTLEQKIDTIAAVGVDPDGRAIQQVVWLHDAPDLKTQQCPIYAASPVTILKEQGHVVKIRTDKSALPNEEKWHKAIQKGNIVEGWIQTRELVQVPIKVWKKNMPGAQPDVTTLIGTNSASFWPKSSTWYRLSADTTHREKAFSQHGPAEIKTSMAWSLANEFVHRTALRNVYALPATSTGPFSLLDSELEGSLYLVSFKQKSSGSQLVLLVSIKQRQIGIVSR